MAKKYDNDFKYKVIISFCDGKNTTEINEIYGVSPSTSWNWVKKFISDGPFEKENELSQARKDELEKLKKKATKRELDSRQLGASTTTDFKWLLEYDKELEQWRGFAEEWIKSKAKDKNKSINNLSTFFKKYVIPKKNNIPKTVANFLSCEYTAPDFYEICFESLKTGVSCANKIVEFIDWILLENFSDEDDFGNKITPPEFCNPLKKYIPDGSNSYKLSQSDKNVLPYKFIKDLRLILCPDNATSFKHWKWAQEATDSKTGGGSWFIVDESIIDKDDPDCVYRTRKSSPYERKTKGVVSDVVYELWSPVTSVALLIKLSLPLRTYQVRMLDSGEMDTYKYVQENKTEQGEWIKNDSPLSKGDKNYPFEKGVLRKFINTESNIDMTGFFINTNKTSDINKDEDEKGYEVPWQYEEVQYWLAKLRDWQQKYNPLDKPTPWTELTKKHIGNVKDIKILKQMGSTTFLFRNASCSNEEHLPIADGVLDTFWHKLLSELQIKVNKNLETQKPIKFIKNRKWTFYPLHSLRVSLITAYALEGGVPIQILSKMVAGHSTLIMTLYYTKPGISYITDTLTEAQNKLNEKEIEAYERFMRENGLEEIKNNSAINDNIAYEAFINARESGGASIMVGDKGICPKGNFGCDCGGVFTNDETGKTKYGPVPGYPEMNCVRCRWFITGPAFLPGLVHHINVIGYNISETSKRMLEFQDKIEELEDEKIDCEYDNQIFTKENELLKYTELKKQEVLKNDKLALDYSSTYRLISKCIQLVDNAPSDSEESVQLVTVASENDIKLSVRNAELEFEQLQVICNGAEIFPETDASKAILKRSQIIDLTLSKNGKQPVMFALTEKEQLVAGNQFMRILVNKIESMKKLDKNESFQEAVLYAEGRKQLSEIGITDETIEEIKPIKMDKHLLTLGQSDNLNFEIIN